MAEATVIKSVQKYLNYLKERGFNVSFAVLFGSHASETATDMSDIDLIVVSPDFDKQIQCRTLDLLWQLAARTDSRIEPFPCGLEQWKKDNFTPIIEIARKAGFVVQPN